MSEKETVRVAFNKWWSTEWTEDRDDCRDGFVAASAFTAAVKWAAEEAANVAHDWPEASPDNHIIARAIRARFAAKEE